MPIYLKDLISSEPIACPRQELAKTEVDQYLSWQFSDLARRPKPLKLLETAAVVRYLHWIAAHGVPREIIRSGAKAIKQYWVGPRTESEAQVRAAVEETAKIIWGDLLGFGDITPASRLATDRFFEHHSHEWFHPWHEPTLDFLNRYALPPGSKQPFRRQNLVAKHRSYQGHASPYLKSDLSERIAAADAALKRTGVRARRNLIARALSASPLTKKPNGEEWGADDVAHRVKTYHRQREHFPEEVLADHWISSFRHAMQVRSGQVS